jgi:type VI secretion system FHA domain protein
MYLTLEIVSPAGAALGADRRKVIGPEGARIGREKGNDWIIRGDRISRQHAQVRYLSGAFYIEGTGKNQLAINGPENFVPNHEPQLLQAGDTVYIEQYEVKASISPGAVPSPAPATAPKSIPADPFGEEGHGVPHSPAAVSGIPQSWEIATLAGPEPGELDPLALLGGVSQPEQPLPPVDLNQGSVLAENFQPPPIPEPVWQPAPAPQGGRSAGRETLIPDEWDISRIAPIEPAEPPPRTATPPRQPPPPVRQSAPPPRVVTPPSRPASSTGTQHAATHIPRPGRQQVAASGDGPSLAAGDTPPPVNVSPAKPWPISPAVAPASVQPRASAPPASAPPPAQSGPSSDLLSLAELLAAAGVTATNISPETSREIGEVLRIVIEGAMEALRARDEIKSEFRVPFTRMGSHDNNPLKFSPNVEAAINTLLAERNPGYLPAPRAFRDAFADIRNHQLAVLEGIRTAFNSMLQQFDPERLREEFERQSKSSGLLNLSGRARLWDQYAEYFRQLTKDPDESFRQLFGDQFAESYEQQLERLKTAGRHTRS